MTRTEGGSGVQLPTARFTAPPPPCRYVAGLNVPLAELQQGLKELVDDSAVLEGWEFLMPDEMSQAFWSTLAWPKRIDEQCKLVAEGNTALREEYAVAMQVGLLHCCPSTHPVPHPHA